MADKTYTNQGQVTNLLAAATTDGLIDYTDVIHSGLIKVLHKMAQGNHIVGYGNFVQSSGASLTEFNFNGGTTAVKFLRDNLLLTYTANTAVTITAPSGTAGTNRYDLIVLNASNALEVIAGTAHATEPKCPDLRADDIPVAMVEVLGGSANDDDGRKVQMFPFKKDENSLSIAYNGGGTTYTETMSIYGGADRTVFKNKIANADFRFILADNTVDEKFEIYSDDDSDGDEGDTSVFSVDGLGATTIGSDLTINGGDIIFSNAQHATAGITATAHNVAGKNLTISAGTTTAGTTNNIAGGSLTFKGGQGKGSGAGGDIIFQTANAGGSGSALNAHATALTISDDLSVTVAGDLTVTGNDIKGSAGTNLTLSGSGDVAVTGDLTVTGNDIKSSTGATAISLSAANVGCAGTLSAVTHVTSPILRTTSSMYKSNPTPSIVGGLTGGHAAIPITNIMFLEPSNAPAAGAFYFDLPSAATYVGAVMTLKNVGNQNAIISPISGQHIDGGSLPAVTGGPAPPVTGLTFTDAGANTSSITWMAPNVLMIPPLRSVTLYAVTDGSLALTDAGNNANTAWALGTGAWMILSTY